VRGLLAETISHAKICKLDLKPKTLSKVATGSVVNRILNLYSVAFMPTSFLFPQIVSNNKKYIAGKKLLNPFIWNNLYGSFL